MRFLTSADWQARWSNLENCKKAAARVLHLVKLHKLTTVILAGDLKDAYHPLDYRVAEFYQNLIVGIRSLDAVPVMLLGNHDRIGLYQDERNWLPLLQAYGAHVVWEAEKIRVGDGYVYMLPFMGSKERWDKATTWLNAQTPNPKKDCLVFHQTLTGARFNRLGTIVKPDEGIPLSMLQPQRYKYCLGGDIHLPQQVSENVWYVGSPFPINWGEVNQNKVFAIVRDGKLDWVGVGLPGWYDPDVKNFTPPLSWIGSHIRIHVPVTRGDDYQQKLEEAKLIAEKKYEGAQVVTVPEFEEQNEAPAVDKTLSDTEQICAYIAQVMPESMQEEIEQMIGYIEYRLRSTGTGARFDVGLRFTKAWARRFLSYDYLEMDFKKGITVVTGTNNDWEGHSNGVGKTNALQPIPVALFGRTFKGQSHDEWVQRGSEGISTAGCEFMLSDASLVRVERTRNPATVRLWVNGAEISSGGRQNDVSRDIETISGYSWDTFATLVYLSSQEVEFLYGTQKQKQEMLAKLQNLERFGIALKSVRSKTQEMERQRGVWNLSIAEIKTQIEVCSEVKDHSKDIERINKSISATEEEIDKIQKAKRVLVVSVERCKDVVDNYTANESTASRRVYSVEGDIRVRQQRMRELAIDGRCSRCLQKINPKILQEEIQRLTEEVKKWNVELAAETKICLVARSLLHKARTELDDVRRQDTQHQTQLSMLSRRVTELREELQQMQSRDKQAKEELVELKKTEARMHSMLDSYEYEIRFLQQAESILSRDGLPAYLTQLLCPRLNRAAKHYSDLFMDGEIQVRFSIEDGEVQTDVINPHGGLSAQDQSSGEGRMVALITSFALREVAPKTNLLILDEPGDGLDAANARAFAQGIKELKNFSVYVMTHNSNIETELSQERQLRVEKRDGRSFLVQ